jgi:hypothetical protein
MRSGSNRVQAALRQYVSPERLARQREAERHVREMIGEARLHQAAVEIADADQRSRSYLDALLRGRSDDRLPRQIDVEDTLNMFR